MNKTVGYIMRATVALIWLGKNILIGLTAYVISGALHVLSDRILLTTLTGGYGVRQLSIYALDILPFFWFSLAFLTLLARSSIPEIVARTPGTIIIIFLAAGMAILLHLPFYPTSLRAIVFLTIMFSFYVAIQLSIEGAFFWVTNHLLKFYRTPIERANNFWVGIVIGTAIATTLLTWNWLAIKFFEIAETETYAPRKEASPSQYILSNDRLNGFFKIEKIDRKLPEKVQIVDVDRDGISDIVSSTGAKGITYWRNAGGRLEKGVALIPEENEHTFGNFAIADYDGDGLNDIVAAKYVNPPETSLENAFLKKSFWYLTYKPVAHLNLYRQLKPGEWQNISDKVFPFGLPTGYRKFEPITWFDATGDGLLDIIVPQYPHPRKAINKLFVQSKEKTFKDMFFELTGGLPALTYPEGSDIADVDNDGDIDFYAYGYLFLNNGIGKFSQICGTALGNIPCDMQGRTDEGALFEDFNNDGQLDILLSHHGESPEIPKYRLLYLWGDPSKPGVFMRNPEDNANFYGFNSYLRAKDVDLDGVPEILTIVGGRLLVRRGEIWHDVLPGITNSSSGIMQPLGWLDFENDGDWDFLVRDLRSGETLLMRNHMKQKRLVRLSAAAHNGQQNQFGATFTFFKFNKPRVQSFRPMAGYNGFTDPRILVPIPTNSQLELKACFPSNDPSPEQTVNRKGVRISVTPVGPKCTNYRINIPKNIRFADIELLAGPNVADVVIHDIKDTAGQ